MGVSMDFKVLWLKEARSNNIPIVPAALYLSAIKEQGLCPNLLKTDCGSQKGDIAAVHFFLTGSNLSHRYGASHANQRIENWWSHVKGSFSAWVISTLNNLFTMVYLSLEMLLTWNAFGLCMLIFFNVS